MKQYYILGKNFYRDTNTLAKSTVCKKFRSEKMIWSPKEKELITKYRKGLIWKDIN